MIEAGIRSIAVLQDQKTMKPVLFGVCQMGEDMVNFKVPFDQHEEDFDGVIDALRDSLAESLQIPTYRVDMNREKLLKRLQYYALELRKGFN